MVWTRIYYLICIDAVIQIAKYSYYAFMRKKIQSIVHSRYQGQQKLRKRQSILKLSYDACFYSFTSIIGIILFRGQYWFPSAAGGCGSCSEIYKQYPNWPSDKRTQLEMFFMLQLGVHIFSVFQMVVIKRKTQRKFYEYLLHHSVAATLILFSMMCNQIAAGTMILIIHDMSDIFIALVRAYMETSFKKPKILMLFLGGITLTVWIYLRIIIFPFCLLANVYINKPLPSDQWSMIQYQYLYLLTMAFVLFCMHLYWTYYIIKSSISSLVKKQLYNAHEKAKRVE